MHQAKWSFGMALIYLKQGKGVRRAVWPMGIYIQRVLIESAAEPYYDIREMDACCGFTDDKSKWERVPRFCKSDLLEEDWEVI